ncbi:helix-turn-helix domain-containing protein [Paenibacillus polymyxa]
MGYKAVAKKLGIDHSTVCQWVEYFQTILSGQGGVNILSNITSISTTTNVF